MYSEKRPVGDYLFGLMEQTQTDQELFNQYLLHVNESFEMFEARCSGWLAIQDMKEE
ncbi:MAG: hypothetical protein U9R57_12440 [Thermodesulfobacteriota bacterium]|nr:hypothetical protein [Thermodesulfobacteriota bacterium]